MKFARSAESRGHFVAGDRDETKARKEAFGGRREQVDSFDTARLCVVECALGEKRSGSRAPCIRGDDNGAKERVVVVEFGSSRPDEHGERRLV